MPPKNDFITIKNIFCFSIKHALHLSYFLPRRDETLHPIPSFPFEENLNDMHNIIIILDCGFGNLEIINVILLVKNKTQQVRFCLRDKMLGCVSII